MSRLLRMVWRALRLRCPACGRGSLFLGWFHMRAACPVCGLTLEREEGYFLGAMLLNLLVAEGLCVIGVALLLVRTWPSPPWQHLQWGAPAAAVLLPVLFYPFSKSLWLALDLLVQTAGEQPAAPPPAPAGAPLPPDERPGQPPAGGERVT